MRLIIEMSHKRWLVRQVQLAGLRILAIDLVGADRFLDQRHGVQRRLVELTAVVAVSPEQ